MAHYAILDKNNIVIEVIKGVDETAQDNFEQFYSNLYNGKTVKRTSYNTLKGTHKKNGTPFRGNYAGVGYKYDSTLNAFIPPKEFDSWVLNTTTFQYEAPVTHPSDGSICEWDEDNQQWINCTTPPSV